VWHARFGRVCVSDDGIASPHDPHSSSRHVRTLSRGLSSISWAAICNDHATLVKSNKAVVDVKDSAANPVLPPGESVVKVFVARRATVNTPASRLGSSMSASETAICKDYANRSATVLLSERNGLLRGAHSRPMQQASSNGRVSVLSSV